MGKGGRERPLVRSRTSFAENESALNRRSRMDRKNLPDYYLQLVAFRRAAMRATIRAGKCGRVRARERRDGREKSLLETLIISSFLMNKYES